MNLFSVKAVTHLLQLLSYFSVFFSLLLSACYLAVALKLDFGSPECGKFCLEGTLCVLIKYGIVSFLELVSPNMYLNFLELFSNYQEGKHTCC